MFTARYGLNIDIQFRFVSVFERPMCFEIERLTN